MLLVIGKRFYRAHIEADVGTIGLNMGNLGRLLFILKFVEATMNLVAVKIVTPLVNDVEVWTVLVGKVADEGLGTSSINDEIST